MDRSDTKINNIPIVTTYSYNLFMLSNLLLLTICTLHLRLRLVFLYLKGCLEERLLGIRLPSPFNSKLSIYLSKSDIKLKFT